MEAQRHLIRGLNPRQAALKIAESEDVSEATARRYVDIAEGEMLRRRRKNDKGMSLALAADRAEATMAMALETKAIVPQKGGGVELVAAPDGKLYLAAQQHLAKLQGTYAPEKHEVFIANFARAMQLVVDLIDREVEDVALRGRLIQGMRGIFEEAPKAKAIDSVSRETVIDVPIVSRETKVP